MIHEYKIEPEKLHSEVVFQTARSGGKGGQNVNKVETKVELRFDIPNSQVLTDEQKDFLQKKLTNKLTNEGVLFLYHQTERSQLANKEKVIRKFDRLIDVYKRQLSFTHSIVHSFIHSFKINSCPKYYS